MSGRETGLLRYLPRAGATRAEVCRALGENTGNLAFWTSIERLFAPKILPYSAEEVQACGRVIVTDLIWIRQGATYPYLEKLVDACPVPFIALSVGLQSGGFDPHFSLAPETVRLLKKIEERAQLGVRGYYTADILRRHGIKNTAVIGCPSMYFWKDPELSVTGALGDGRTSANFRTFYGQLSIPEKHFLSYCASHEMRFIEQTSQKFLPDQARDAAFYNFVAAWLYRCSAHPFGMRDWFSALEGVRFSLGGRFHGNVIALWKGIKALFFTVDSRTRELTEFFSLPTFPLEKFDGTRDVRDYYEMADYSAFNKRYPALFRSFTAFAHKNGLTFSDAPALPFGKVNDFE